LDGEISARLVRALSMALLPVLAVPFGVTAQRSGRQSGIVAGIVVLVLYYHLIQLAQSVGTAGLLDPRPLLWGVFALFAAFCFVAFRRASRRMGDGLLDRAIDMMAGLPARLRRIRSRQQASGTP
ncbi:LptF/LptG family permease, partial [Endobacter medicaginis]